MDNGWISVEERLPGVGVPVLVAFKDCPTPVTAFIDHGHGDWMPYTDHISWNGEAHFRAFDPDEQPTHWQHCPATPAGQLVTCELCGGDGSIDQTLGGYAESMIHVCPDCDGDGERLLSPTHTAPRA